MSSLYKLQKHMHVWFALRPYIHKRKLQTTDPPHTTFMACMIEEYRRNKSGPIVSQTATKKRGNMQQKSKQKMRCDSRVHETMAGRVRGHSVAQ